MEETKRVLTLTLGFKYDAQREYPVLCTEGTLCMYDEPANPERQYPQFLVDRVEGYQLKHDLYAVVDKETRQTVEFLPSGDNSLRLAIFWRNAELHDAFLKQRRGLAENLQLQRVGSLDGQWYQTTTDLDFNPQDRLEFHPVATLESIHGGRAQIIVGEGCYVLYLRGENNSYAPTAWWFPAAAAVMRTLPEDPQDALTAYEQAERKPSTE